eukprot:1155857-Pelagomonas_calceolata.AAC.9
MNGLHSSRHHVGLSFCAKALSKGRYGSSLVGMDACQNEKLMEQGIEVPENISQAIPDRVFPYGTGSSAQHQSHPDAVFVHSIPGQPSHIDPTKIPPQDRDIHLVDFKFCPTFFQPPFHSRSCNCPAYQHLNQAQNPQLEKSKQERQGDSEGGGVLGVGRWRAGEGDPRRPGAWRTTLQITISSNSGFLLG